MFYNFLGEKKLFHFFGFPLSFSIFFFFFFFILFSQYIIFQNVSIGKFFSKRMYLLGILKLTAVLEQKRKTHRAS